MLFGVVLRGEAPEKSEVLLRMEYDPSQFAGSAPFYLRGRPPYSADLGSVMARELGLNASGRLLDVGSGPGTIGVQLAPLFEHVTLLEPDADMLAAARRNAADAGVTSIDFVQATAEDMPKLDLPSLRVVTFGQSFHRTDRIRVAENVHKGLEGGGSMVLISHDPTRPVPEQPHGTSLIPHEAIRDLIRTFLGPELRSGSRLVSDYSPERYEDTLARTSFGAPRAVYAKGRSDIVRDVDGVIANYLSMSYSAPNLYGPRVGEFVTSLRSLLHREHPDGRFWDWPGDTQLLIATRSE